MSSNPDQFREEGLVISETISPAGDYARDHERAGYWEIVKLSMTSHTRLRSWVHRRYPVNRPGYVAIERWPTRATERMSFCRRLCLRRLCFLPHSFRHLLSACIRLQHIPARLTIGESQVPLSWAKWRRSFMADEHSTGVSI